MARKGVQPIKNLLHYSQKFSTGDADEHAALNKKASSTKAKHMPMTIHGLPYNYYY